MGGKNAIIVDDDADLDEAVAGIARSCLWLPGPEVLRLLARHRARKRSTTPSSIDLSKQRSLHGGAG